LLILSIVLFLFLPGLRDYFFYKGEVIDNRAEYLLRQKVYSLKLKYLDSLSSCVVEEAQLKLEPLPKNQNEYFVEDDEENQALISVKPPDPTPEKGEGFVIPPDGDPNDLSFLEGCWESETGLINEANNLPVIYTYCFNKGGSGTATVRELNKSGKLIDTCRASVNARRNKDTVVIKDRGPKCGDGGKYSATTFICSNGPNNSTKCTGDNGGLKFDSLFKYVGKS
jgi:hypothetical protein